MVTNRQLTLKKYRESNKGKKTQLKYVKSNKGKDTIRKIQQRYRKKHSKRMKLSRVLHFPIENIKKRFGLVLENCAICDSSDVEIHHPNIHLPLHVYFLCRKHHREQHRRK